MDLHNIPKINDAIDKVTECTAIVSFRVTAYSPRAHTYTHARNAIEPRLPKAGRPNYLVHDGRSIDRLSLHVIQH